MCGIAGIINYQHYDLEAMKNALVHRGPDQQSIYCENNIALIHTRLAIQDIHLGTQPFHCNACSIIFNGEIYNHLALRKLIPHVNFTTKSDTETLLHLYLQYDIKIFDLLDGMFAFCIYDKRKNQLFFARDRAGKKPLYFTKINNSFIFSSELNAIKSISPLAINEEAIESYLRTGFFHGAHTAYSNVQVLAAGTYMTVDVETQSCQQQKYFDIIHYYEQPNTDISLPDAVSKIDQLLQKSIQERLLASDIEVGVFLSGGIDSNLIAAIAARMQPNLRTFTVKSEAGFNEAHLAAIAAKKYGTNHTELTISLNLEQDIEKILVNYGCPFMDSSAIPTYYVAKEARKHVGVVLTGDGADELFAGYRRYVTVANRLFMLFKYVSGLQQWLPKPNKKQSLYQYFYRLLNMAGKKNIDFYLAATTDIFENVVQFNNNLLQAMNEKIKSIDSKKKISPLKKMLYLDFNFLLFSDLLIKMDIATMAHSLEARSPFLAKGLLEVVPTLPDRFKIDKLKTKKLLRELSKKYLPNELINQPKRGFEVPLVNWVDRDLREKIHDALSVGCYAEQYVEKKVIGNLLNRKVPVQDEKRAKMLWSLFCLEIWYRNENKRVTLERNYE